MDPHPPDQASTDSLEAALAHARAQAGTTSATQATIPSTAATELPEGVAGADVTWAETLAAGSYATSLVPRGTLLRLDDLAGGTCANLQLWHAGLTSERLNPADTVKVQWQAYLAEGALLLSDRGRVLATLVADTSGRHDALCGHASRRSADERFGDSGAHGPTPNTRDLLALAAARHGLERRDLTHGLNLFTQVRVAEDGGLHLQPPTGRPAHVVLRAELDLVVAVAVAPHPLDRRPYDATGPVRLTAWRADRPDPDPFRATTPERLRAFENTEQLLRAGAR